MNCREGDLAIIIQDYAGCEANIGKLVTVSDVEDVDGCLCWDVTPVAGLLWVVHGEDGHLYMDSRDIDHPDAWLRPIRDQPGADETLTWAGKPQSIPKETV